MNRTCGRYFETFERGIALALALLTLPAVTPASAGVLSGNCRMANQPAATLLIPYFRVDLANPAGATTVVPRPPVPRPRRRECRECSR